MFGLLAAWFLRPFAREAMRKRRELVRQQKAARKGRYRSPTSDLPMSAPGAPFTAADHERARIAGQQFMQRLAEEKKRSGS